MAIKVPFVSRWLARPRPEAKKAPFIWPVAYNGAIEWRMGNFKTYVEEGFDLNALIYSAIMYKVRSAAQVRLRAYRGDPDNPEPLPPGHPLSRLVTRPNPHQSWPQLHGLLTAYLNLAGNSYLWLERKGAVGGVPKAMWPLRPDRVYIIPHNGAVAGYKYVPDGHAIGDGIPLLPEDVIHVKLPNPLDDFEGLGYGLSPMSPLAKAGDIDNSVTKFVKKLFDNGAMPVGALKFQIPLEPEQVSEVKAKWNAMYGGSDKWSDIAVLEMGADYQRLGLTFEELGFDKVDERNESRILGPFGVPPILIGSKLGLERSTDTNYKNARRSFWEDTMLYELGLLQSEFDYYLTADDDSFVRHDLSGVAALQKDIPMLVDSSHKLWQMGVPANIAFQTVGLEVEDGEAGKLAYIPNNMIPFAEWLAQQQALAKGSSEVPVAPAAAQPADPRLASGQEGPEPPEPPEPLDDPPSTKGDLTTHQAEVKARHKKHVDRLSEIAEAHEDRFLAAARACFKADLEAVLAILARTKKAAHLVKASFNWEVMMLDIKDYLEAEGGPFWEETFAPLIAGVCKDVGEDWAVQLGTEFSLRNILAEKWFDGYVLKFADPINETTSGWVHNILAKGQAYGMTMAQLEKELTWTFKAWMDEGVDPATHKWLDDRVPPNRVELIARTETIRAANAGSQQLFKEWGAPFKYWSAAHDNRTRPTHRAADGQVKPIDEPFLVGGHAMMQPLDGSLGAPASEIILCRCAVLPDFGEQLPMPLNQTVDPAPVAVVEPPKPTSTLHTYKVDEQTFGSPLKAQNYLFNKYKVTADLKGMSAVQLRTFVNELDRMAEMFPGIIDADFMAEKIFSSMSSEWGKWSASKDTVAFIGKATSKSTGKLTCGFGVNIDLFNMKEARKQIKKNWTVGDPDNLIDPQRVTISHEYGHLIDYYMQVSANGKKKVTWAGKQLSISSAVGAFKRDAFLKLKKGSKYAGTKVDEAWAEGIAEIVTLPPEKWSEYAKQQYEFLQTVGPSMGWEFPTASVVEELIPPAITEPEETRR